MVISKNENYYKILKFVIF